jgi:hypothetical protein
MPDRFPEQVATVLTEAGWNPDEHDDDLIDEVIDYVEDHVGRDGATSESFPAAVTALQEFGGLCVIQDGEGLAFRRRPFLIDSTQVAATTETLADFGEVIGTRLFPLGMEGDHDSIIAIAENGHVFALDHAGEWHLGDSMDDAIVTLVTGAAPPRVDSHGSW